MKKERKERKKKMKKKERILVRIFWAKRKDKRREGGRKEGIL